MTRALGLLMLTGGLFLVYDAFKNRNPWDDLRSMFDPRVAVRPIKG